MAGLLDFLSPAADSPETPPSGLLQMVPKPDAIAEVLDNEGGFQSDPSDTGNFIGANNLGTNFGITPQVLAESRGVDPTSLTRKDMKDLTEVEARTIYEGRFSAPFDGVKDETLRKNLIDMGVNAGVSGATKILQQAIGVNPDGVMGPQTISAMEQSGIDSQGYSQLRDNFYTDLAQSDPKKAKFLKGWLNRSARFKR